MGEGATWVELAGQWHWENTWHKAYTLASLFQYSRGTSSELYEYWCKRGKVPRPARKPVQAKSSALEFDHIKESKKHGRAGVTQWLEQIKIELPKLYRDKYGKKLPEITPEVLQEMSSKATDVFLLALLNTRNRNIFSNPIHERRQAPGGTGR